MSKTKIAINGFGRIGRQFFKIAFEKEELEIVAINDLADINNLAYLLKFDSVYGEYDKKVDAKEGNLIVDGKKIKYLSEKNPGDLPWKEMEIDVVVESTGFFTSYEKAKPHLEAGAKRVVISAGTKDNKTPVCTPNLNEEEAKKEKISSNASCTTNAVTPVAAVMLENLGIEYSMLNTIHGYTSSQNLVDGPGGDFRRGRAGALNITPTSTGSAVYTQKVISEMKEKFDGIAMRVPIPAGSILDFTFLSKKETSVEEVNNILKKESKKEEWKGILEVTEEPIVSSDIVKKPYGSLVDLDFTRVVGGKLVKILSWYDNEWGYASMLARHVINVTRK